MDYSNQFPVREKKQRPKPTSGNLLYNGKVIIENRSFAALQGEKKKLIASGYRKELFKITYYYGSR